MGAKKFILVILYSFLMIIISVPLFISIFGIKNIDEPLHGVTNKVELSDFTITSFYNRTYQLNLSKFLNQEIAFGSSLIRFYNQIEFSLFDNIINSNVVVGKNDFLYETWHIDTYNGGDFVGKGVINNKIEMIAAIDSVLQLSNTKLIVVLAAGKPSIYPENIPDYLKKDSIYLTNYNYYAEQLKKSSISYIDFNDWFKDIKPDFKRNLFPEMGAHWSIDASILVLDSLIDYLNYYSYGTLNKLIIDTIIHKNQPYSPDYDIGKISNLLFSPSIDYYYPKYSVENTYNTDKKLIVIGDSFFWTINQQKLDKVFNEIQYWFYFKDVYQRDQEQKSINEIDYIKEIKNADFVLLFSSPSPLAKFGWGFIDKAYFSLVNKNKIPNHIMKIMKSIRENPKLLSITKKKAEKRKISVDSMLYIDARYIYRIKHNNQ